MTRFGAAIAWLLAACVAAAAQSSCAIPAGQASCTVTQGGVVYTLTPSTSTAYDVTAAPPALGILIAGQSNAINEATGPAYAAASANIYNLNADTGAVAPITGDPIPGVGSQGGVGVTSFVLPLADMLAAEGKWSKVYVADVAVGSTYSADWAAGGQYNARLSTGASRLRALGASTVIAVWVQGEGDAATGVTQAQYQANLQSVQATIAAAGLVAKIVVNLETVCGDQPSATIRAAQAALVDNKKFCAGPDLDTLLGAAYREDIPNPFPVNGCHFNQAAAWNNVAPMIKAAVDACVALP